MSYVHLLNTFFEFSTDLSWDSKLNLTAFINAYTLQYTDSDSQKGFHDRKICLINKLLKN